MRGIRDVAVQFLPRYRQRGRRFLSSGESHFTPSRKRAAVDFMRSRLYVLFNRQRPILRGKFANIREHTQQDRIADFGIPHFARQRLRIQRSHIGNLLAKRVLNLLRVAQGGLRAAV